MRKNTSKGFWIEIITFLLVNFGVPLVEGCRTLTFKNIKAGHSLSRHVLTTKRVQNEMECQIQCFIEEKCMSLNLGPLQDDKRRCELNKSDHVRNPEDLVARSDYYYYSPENPCDLLSSQCPTHFTCQPKYTQGGGFDCVCLIGHDCDLDGGWSAWSSWSACSTQCFNGTRTRSRDCTHPTPQRNGSICSGIGQEKEACNETTITSACFMNITCRSETFNDPGKTRGTNGIAYITVDGTEYSLKRQGHNLASFYMNGTLFAKVTFDTVNAADSGNKMRDHINSLPNNLMVIVAVQENIEITPGYTYAKPATNALNNIGAVPPPLPGFRSSWCLLGHTGGHRSWIQQVNTKNGDGPAIINTRVVREEY